MAESLSRRRLIHLASVAGGAGMLSALVGPVNAAAAAPAADESTVHDHWRTPSHALFALRAGNRRWANGDQNHPHESIHRRDAVAAGQDPYAVVFSCIDSRVPPELVFDTGVGDIFVVRTGAHTIDDVAFGSIEFGPAELDTPLIFVLGHERCGAVIATINAIQHEGGHAPGHLQAIVDALKPAYNAAIGRPGDLVDNMVREQVRLTVAQLSAAPLLAERITAGTLAIVGGRYDLDNWKVEIITPTP